VLEIQESGSIRSIRGDRDMRTFSKDLLCETGQHIVWSNLDKNAGTRLVHRFHFVRKSNRHD
jgi:hypothetical protein